MILVEAFIYLEKTRVREIKGMIVGKKVLLLSLAVIILLITLLSLQKELGGYLDETTHQEDGRVGYFNINVNDKQYNVIVGRPDKKNDVYPLIIYHHGEWHQNSDSIELQGLALIFAGEGFLFWAPERTPWDPKKPREALKEAQVISKSILNLALTHPEVNKSNINVAGFSLGSWIAFEEDARSPDVRTVNLIGFGAPLDDPLIYDYVHNLVNNTDYSTIQSRILVTVSGEDTYMDIEVGETLRRKMVQANKTIDCVEYQTGDHMSLAGPKSYTIEWVRYVRGEKINTSEYIKVDEDFRRKWRSIRKTGYW